MITSSPFRHATSSLTAALLIVTSPASAQQPRRITWCEHPSRDAKWSTQEITAKLAQRIRDGGDSSLPDSLGTPVLERILERVAARMERLPGLSKLPDGALPPADHRYTPAVIRSVVTFTLGGDGSLAAATGGAYSDSLFVSDLITALRQSGDDGELAIDGNAASRYDFKFSITPLRSGVAEWRAFTLFAPRTLPALVDRQRPAVQYPSAALRWEATIVLQFVVGWDGKVRRETIQVVPEIDTKAWSKKEREVLERFVNHSKYALAQWTFFPGETAGCLVDELTDFKFVFQSK